MLQEEGEAKSGGGPMPDAITVSSLEWGLRQRAQSFMALHGTWWLCPAAKAGRSNIGRPNLNPSPGSWDDGGNPALVLHGLTRRRLAPPES